MGLETLLRAFFVELVKSVAQCIADEIKNGHTPPGVQGASPVAGSELEGAENVGGVPPTPPPTLPTENITHTPVVMPSPTSEPVPVFRDLAELTQFVTETHQRVDMSAGTTKVRAVITQDMGFTKVTDIPPARWQELRQKLEAL